MCSGLYLIALSRRLTTACSSSGGFTSANRSSGQSTTTPMSLASALLAQTSAATASTSATRASCSATSRPSTPRSRLESASRSSMIEFRRSACPAMMRRNRRPASGSSIAPSASVSAKPLIDVTGVLSSCDTLATKSLRTASRRRRRVTSFTTTTAPATAPSSVCSSEPFACRNLSSPATYDREVGLDGFLAGQHGVQRALQLRIAGRLLDRHADDGVRTDVEQPSRGAVDGDDAPVRVDGDDALDHALEHRLALVALARERAQLVVELGGHPVHGLGDRGELDGRRCQQLAAEVTGGEPVGALAQLAHGQRDAPRDVPAEQRGDQRDRPPRRRRCSCRDGRGPR